MHMEQRTQHPPKTMHEHWGITIQKRTMHYVQRLQCIACAVAWERDSERTDGRTKNGTLHHDPSAEKAIMIEPQHSEVLSPCTVSNLAFISKVLENVVACQLNTYLKDHELLEPCQSGYTGVEYRYCLHPRSK